MGESLSVWLIDKQVYRGASLPKIYTISIYNIEHRPILKLLRGCVILNLFADFSGQGNTGNTFEVWWSIYILYYLWSQLISRLGSRKKCILTNQQAGFWKKMCISRPIIRYDLIITEVFTIFNVLSSRNAPVIRLYGKPLLNTPMEHPYVTSL